MYLMHMFIHLCIGLFIYVLVYLCIGLFNYSLTYLFVLKKHHEMLPEITCYGC